jgi:hypothetical protein
MKAVLRVPLLLLLAAPAPAADIGASCPDHSNEDRCAVERLEGHIAMVLTEQGYDTYAAQFHPDYTNWADGGALLTRDAFLEGVQRWYRKGNRAVSVRMVPVSTEIFGDFALSRFRLREDFNDDTSFVGNFASLARKHDGKWLLFRTSFTTLYRGKTSSAPGL